MSKRFPSMSESLKQDRPIMLAVSTAELLALMKWHGSEARKVSNRAGSVIVGRKFTARDLAMLCGEGTKLVDHHAARIRGLAAIAKEQMEIEEGLKQ